MEPFIMCLVVLDVPLNVLDELFVVCCYPVGFDNKGFWQFTGRIIVNADNSSVSDSGVCEQVGF